MKTQVNIPLNYLDKFNECCTNLEIGYAIIEEREHDLRVSFEVSPAQCFYLGAMFGLKTAYQDVNEIANGK